MRDSARCCLGRLVVRDLAILVLHLLTTIARLAGPGGARSVVAESVLLKQQLLILDRTRKRAPNLRLTDRVVAGVCASRRAPAPPGRVVLSRLRLHPRPSLAPSPGAEDAEISPAVLAHGTAEAGSAGTEPRLGGRHRRHETAKSDMGVPTSRATD